MGIYKKNKEVIALTIISKAVDEKIDWNDFLKEMKPIIIKNSNHSLPIKYKSEWRSAFRKIAKEMRITCKRGEDEWESIIGPHLKQSIDSFTKSSSTSSLNYQRELTAADKLQLSENYEKITKKWVLSSGTAVEDIMHMKSKEFLHEHPTHSMIMYPKSPLWRSCFSAEDLDEIISHNNSHNELDRPLPASVKDLLAKLDKKNTFRSIYDEFDAVKADPVYNPEEYWVKRSILDYACLFIENEKVLPQRTESDLLNDVYGFIKKSFRLSNTTVETDSSSMSSGESKNIHRTTGSVSKVSRKHSYKRADLVFKYLSHEIGCVKIGLEDEGESGTEKMNERSIKTPVMMKSFAYHLVQQYKIDASKIITVGLIISGFNISGLLMSHDKGSVSMIKRTKRLHMPESVTEIARLLPPVLKLVYNCALVMRETTVFISNVSSSVSLDNDGLVYFPPCFVSAKTSHKKRKASLSEATEEG